MSLLLNIGSTDEASAGDVDAEGVGLLRTEFLFLDRRREPTVGELGSLLDPWQPALLELVTRTARAGVAADVPIGVCGEAASDPLLALVLTGVGCSSLSMAAPALPEVRATLATVTLAAVRRAGRAGPGRHRTGRPHATAW